MSRFDAQQFFSIARLYLAMQFSLLGISSVFIFTSRIDWLTQNPANVIDLFQFTLAKQTDVLVNTCLIIFACASTTHLVICKRNNELITIAAAGISPWRFLRPMMIFTLFLMALQFYLVHVNLPKDLAWSRKVADQIGIDTIESNIQPGTFRSFGDNLSIFVEKRSASGTYQGFVAFDRRDAARTAALFGKTAFIQIHEGKLFLILQDGAIIYEPVQKAFAPVEVRFNQYNLDMSSFAVDEAVGAGSLRVKELDLKTLLKRVTEAPHDISKQPMTELALLVTRTLHVINPMVVMVIMLFMLNEFLAQRQGLFVPLLIEIILLSSHALMFGLLRRAAFDSFFALILSSVLPFIYMLLASQQGRLAAILRSGMALITFSRFNEAQKA